MPSPMLKTTLLPPMYQECHQLLVKGEHLLKSTQNLVEPSFFLTRTMGDDHVLVPPLPLSTFCRPYSELLFGREAAFVAVGVLV